MAEVLSILYQLANNIGFIVLAGTGLVIILGIVDIINLAHAEFIMLGAYITASSVHAGVPIFAAYFLSFIGVGLIGIVLEKSIIRLFYDNKLNCMVVTWGIALILSQGMLITFGPSLKSIGAPFGPFDYGGKSFSIYRWFLNGVSLLIVVAIWFILYRTNFGIRVRATMQNPRMAEASGVNVNTIYTLTFGLGAAFAGLTGGLWAPLAPIVPRFGDKFMAPGFFAVVVGGGSNVVTGIAGSSVLLGSIRAIFATLFGTFWGRMSLLIAALVIIRLMPFGISGFLERSRRKT